MELPASHPRRFELAGEVHARPHEALVAPVRASHIAVLVEAADRAREHAHVARLCREAGIAPPEPGAIHFSADLGAFRLR